MVPNQNQAMISVRNVTTTFGTKQVHKGVSFDVKRGTIVGLIGGSGTGKSVLVREILGLLKPTSGEILIAEKSIWSISDDELSDLRTRIGVLFQSGALFSALTVGENVAAPIRERLKLNEDILSEVVLTRLLLSGLTEDAADKMPSELSGGMIKRAAIARALAMEPEILFLDEPTSGLDPINARAVDQLIRNLCDNLGLTILVITHDVLTLKAVVDSIVILYEGKVLTTGPYKEVSVFNHPWVKEYFARSGDEV